MGLLDDAIKEHLELKRRHGADPGEVARLEHEALGPARRDPAPAAVRRARGRAGGAPVAPIADDDPPSTTTAARRGARRGAPRGSDPPHRAEPEPEPEPGRSRRAHAGAGAGAAGRGRAADAPVLARGGRGRDGRAPRRPRSPSRARRSRGPAAEDVVPADDEPEARTCSRRRRSSCRRRPSTTGSGSSRSLRATSTSSGQAPDVARRLHVAPADRQRPRRRPPRRRHRRRDDARLRARDASSRRRPSCRPRPSRAPTTATASGRSSASCPSPGTRRSARRSPSRTRAREREAHYVQQTMRRPAGGRRRARRQRRRARVDAPGAGGLRRRARSRARSSPRSASTPSDAHPELPPQVVSTGLAHLMIPARDDAVLQPRAPDDALLDALLSEHGVVCAYLAALRPGPRRGAGARLLRGRRADHRGPGHRLGRRPAVRLPERAHRRRRASTSSQGEAMGRPSRLMCEAGERVRVAGDVVLLAEGEIEL